MLDWFINFISSIYELLPNSFIQSSDWIGKEGMEYIARYLNYVNWFIPFDIAEKILTVWCGCMLLYYCSSTVQGIIDKVIKIFTESS